MRFRVKDMLLLTGLLSIYLTILMYVLNSAVGDMLDKSGLKLYMATFLGIYPCFMFLHRRWAIREAKSFVCELRALIPWTSLLIQLSFVLAVAIGIHLFEPDSLTIPFVCSTVVFLVSLMRSFSYGYTKACHLGIIYQTSLLPWKEVTVIYGPDGEIQKLQTGRYWWSPVIIVPPEHREQITQLLSQATAEASA